MAVPLACSLVFGKPLVMWLGIATGILVLSTAGVGYAIYRGKKIPFKAHIYLAAATLVMLFIHGTVALTAYL